MVAIERYNILQYRITSLIIYME